MKNSKIRNICIVGLVLILFVYLVICINSYMNNSKVGFFSTRFYIMSSDCPEANVYTGDLVFAKSIKTEDIKENDNIIFKKDDKMIAKKVTRVENNNGIVNFYIENDDSNFNERLENVQIVGKIVSKVKGIRKCCFIYSKPIGNFKCDSNNNMYYYYY